MRIFRLCLSTLLVGADLAQQAGLEDLLITNEQRFERVCRALSDSSVNARERLDGVQSIVDALEHHRFLGEAGLRLDTMVNAVRLAAQAWLDSAEHESSNVSVAMTSGVSAMQSTDPLTRLSAIERLEKLSFVTGDQQSDERLRIVQKLSKTVWSYVFSHYFWLLRERESSDDAPTA
jgi:hypothetical protein